MKTLNKKIAIGLLLGSLCVTSIGTAVFASAPTNQNGTPSQMCQDKGDKRSHHNPQQMMKAAKEKLDKLVNDGVISKDQENKLIAFFKEKAKTMKADMEKMKGMSEEERKAYFQKMREQHPNFIGEVKNAAGLSDDQVKAVISALRPEHRQHGPRMTPEQVSQNLSKLVSDGTITQTQADSVVNFFKDKAVERKAEREKVKAMTEEERKAYFEEHHKNHANMINDLKSAAGLTDEQAKAVADVLRPHHGQHEHGPQDQGPKEPVNQ